MKDAGSPLRKAYKALLSGLTYNNGVNSVPVKVYSLMAPNGAVAPYVIIGPWQGNKGNTKDSFGQTGETNLDVVTRFAGDQRSTKPAGDIADNITELLKPTPSSEVLEVEGFQCWNTCVENTQDLIQPGSTDTTVRKIITVSHALSEQ